MRSFRNGVIYDRSKYYSIMHGIAIELKEITGGIAVTKYNDGYL